MIPTDVYDEFLKIAMAKGMISEAKEDSKEEISDIEVLYGIKPKKNIVEEAHPENAIISPAHKPLNGVMQNAQQAQDSTLQWVLPPSVYKVKKAEAELLNTLISLGYKLDNSNEEELMTLADGCSEQLTKTALWPAVIGLVGAGLGVISLYNNFGSISQGVDNDCDIAIEAIRKLQEQDSSLDKQLNQLIGGISKIKELHKQANAAATQIASVPQTGNLAQDAVNFVQSSFGAAAKKIIGSYKNASKVLSDQIVKVYVPLIESIDESESRSNAFFFAMKKTWNAVAGGPKNTAIKALVGSNIDMIGAGGLAGSLKNSVKLLSAKEKVVEKYVSQNQKSLEEQMMAEPESTPVTEEAPKPEAAAQAPVSKPAEPSKQPSAKDLLDEIK